MPKTPPGQMTEHEQQNALIDELSRVLCRFRDEFDMSLASTIGCIELVKEDILLDHLLSDEEEDGA